MARGPFVVLEGPEGAGKTTLATGLITRMRQDGLDPVAVREPGGTDVAELLRRELLAAERRWTAEGELLYLATARADLVARVIEPALAGGRIVLSDRYELSTRAYQGAGRGIALERVEWVNQAATGGLRPDLSLVLDIDPAVGRARQRAAGKHADRMERESEAFHDRVAAAYLAAAGAGVHHLSGERPPAEVLAQAWACLVEFRPETFLARPE